MIEIMSSPRSWLVNGLSRIVSSLKRGDHSATAQSKFVDLAPTEAADKAGIYSEALLFATNNPKVTNIALTGPYGSGKSSIVLAFLKRYQRPSLHISLAAFAPEADSAGEKVSRQEIERSILQQMLYGADANKLPLSRFKRIRSPGVWSAFKSLYLLIGFLALSYVISRRDDYLSGVLLNPFAPNAWFSLGALALATTFLWATFHHFYIASFGLSLK